MSAKWEDPDVTQARLRAGRLVADQPKPPHPEKFWEPLLIGLLLSWLAVGFVALIAVQVAYHWRGALWCAFAVWVFLACTRKGKR